MALELAAHGGWAGGALLEGGAVFVLPPVGGPEEPIQTSGACASLGTSPIYVSPDSSDLWASPELFQADKNGRLTQVAGCPPDAFAENGQLWGNPLYDWDYHHATGYEWWGRPGARLHRVRRGAHRPLPRVRELLCHSGGRGDGQKRGCGAKGPGTDFVSAIRKKLPAARIIAEDLGYLTAEVKALLEASGYPGMKVLQFAFDSREGGDYMPHNYVRNSVAYTGTHDNTTTAAWQDQAAPADVALARRYMACPEGDLTGAFIRTALACVSDTAIIPLQDWLGLGAEAPHERAQPAPGQLAVAGAARRTDPGACGAYPGADRAIRPPARRKGAIKKTTAPRKKAGELLLFGPSRQTAAARQTARRPGTFPARSALAGRPGFGGTARRSRPASARGRAADGRPLFSE